MSATLNYIEAQRKQALQRIAALKQACLLDLLSLCTKEQQAFFARMYPHGVGSMSDDQQSTAIQQLENTIYKNRS